MPGSGTGKPCDNDLCLPPFSNPTNHKDAISILFRPYLFQQLLVLPNDGLAIKIPLGNLPYQPLNSMRSYILFHYFKRRIRTNHCIWIDAHPLKFNHELQGIVERGLDYLGILRNALD